MTPPAGMTPFAWRVVTQLVPTRETADQLLREDPAIATLLRDIVDSAWRDAHTLTALHRRMRESAPSGSLLRRALPRAVERIMAGPDAPLTGPFAWACCPDGRGLAEALCQTIATSAYVEELDGLLEAQAVARQLVAADPVLDRMVLSMGYMLSHGRFGPTVRTLDLLAPIAQISVPGTLLHLLTEDVVLAVRGGCYALSAVGEQ